MCDVVTIKMFSSVKYIASGEIPSTVHKILCDNGGQRMQYYSDFVTHCIVGENAPENDLSEARDLYDIPAVTVDWVLQSAKCNKILCTGGFRAGDDQIFSGVVVSMSKVGKRDRKRLWAMLTYNGGSLDPSLRSCCTHLVTCQMSGAKYAHASKCSSVKIVTPDWVSDSLRAGKRCDEALYHPRYLIPPQPDRLATCFTVESENRLSDGSLLQPNSEMKAVLEKLKMCFPWNKPKDRAPDSVQTSADACPSPQGQQIPTMANITPPRLQATFRDQPKLSDYPSIQATPPPHAYIKNRELAALPAERGASPGQCLPSREPGLPGQQLGAGRAAPVSPLLVSRTVGPGGGSPAPGGTRQVAKGSFQHTASIAARRQAAFKCVAFAGDKALLPPWQCLQGCVFYIIECDDVSLPTHQQLKKIVAKYGGTVESSYEPTVTHVLCTTLKEPIVQQAAEDGKLCITAYWLNDVLQNKKIVPPWQAIHLPVAFCSSEKLCKDLTISISQFEVEDRVRIQIMVKKLGAVLTQSFSKDNDLLVCNRASGYKYAKACEWGIPVVNVQWLTDMYLSNPARVPHPKQAKYQNFDVGNFQQPHLDSRLMAAWGKNVAAERNGINMSAPKRSQEDDASSQPQVKRQKLDNHRNTQHGEVKVAFSLTQEKQTLTKKVVELGGAVVSDIKDATHLVMSTKNLSAKFFCALSTAMFILSHKWVEDSYAAKTFLDERPYTLDIKWEGDVKITLSSVLKKPNRTTLFKGKTFFVAPGVTPKSSVVKEIIEAAGGVVETQLRTLEHLQASRLDATNYFVVCGSKDRDSVRYLSDSGFAVFYPSAVMISILKQKFWYPNYS